MLRKQQVWNNSEMLTYGPVPTMQRERKLRSNRKVKHVIIKVVMSNDNSYIQGVPAPSQCAGVRGN